MNCALSFGFLEDGSGSAFNSFVFVAPDGMASLYRQVHVAPGEQGGLPAGDRGSSAAGGSPAGGKASVTPGTAFRVVDTAWGRVGLATGADLFFPETLACLSQMGADVVLAGIRSPAAQLGMILRERARSFNIHLVLAQLDRAPMLVGTDGGLKQSESNLGLDTGLGPGDAAWARFDCGPDSAVRLKPAMKRRRTGLYHALAVRA
jgi:hypothetical protein